MVRWVPCFNVINLLKKILEENVFKDWEHPLQGNNDLLSLTQPEAIAEIHRKYYAAGADIVETNTFSSTTIAMADYFMEDLVYELNYESARIAKQVADEFTAKEPHKPRFVVGSIGPTNKTACHQMLMIRL